MPPAGSSWKDPRRGAVVRLFLALALLAGAGFALRAIHDVWLIDRLVAQAVEHAAIPASASPSETFDRVRTFVNDNGQQVIDAEYYATSASKVRLLEEFLRTARGERHGNPVHVDCFTRTRVMSMMLEHLGFETRRIDIYSTTLQLESHTFLEVLNPATGVWETQDPAYDVYWTDAATGARISLAQRAGDIGTILPCGRAGCRWDVASRENFKAENIARRYFEIIAVTNRERGESYSLFTPRADIAAVFDKDGRRGTFCALQAKKCADGIYPIDGVGPHR